jgi:peptidyl-prolyl cis-trans isomerase D
MLRAMRNDFKKYSWTLWLVIIAFVGGFIITDAFRGESMSKRGLVYVNDQLMVRGEEFQRQLLRTLENYKNQMKNNFNKALINQFRIPENILQSLVTVAVIRSEAKKLSISASDKELKQKIIADPAFQQDGKFIGLDRYQQILAYSKIDVQDFEDQLRDEVVREKFQSLITGSMVIDNGALMESYKKEKDKAELDFITLKPDRIKQEIKIDDNDPAIKEYYDTHKEDFKSQEKRSGYVIAYKFDDYKKDVKVEIMDMRNYFRQNRSDYIIPGKTKVSRILLKYEANTRDEVFKKIEALKAELTPQNFADKAKELSQDNRAQQGGDHGYEAWKQFTSQERSIIEGLEQGQHSTPIDTRSGFSIVCVTEKVRANEQNFDNVKDKIKDTLENEKVNALVQEKLKKIHDKLGKADNIKAKASEMNVQVIETELLTSGKPIKDIDQMGYISRKLFTMKEKDIEFPVNFVKGLAIVQLAKIEEPVVEPLDKVKDKVKAKLVTAKKLDLLIEDAKKFASQLNVTTDEKQRKEFLDKNDLTVDSAVFKRGSRLGNLPQKDDLDNLIFSAPEKTFTDPVTFPNSIVTFNVKNRTITTDADFLKERTDFYQQKVKELKNNYFRSYMSNRMKSYEVTLNEDLYQEITDWVMSRFN